MIWQSLSLNNSRTFSRPRPPTPITATLTLSLGARCPGPPRTCRGTIVNTPAAAAPARRKWRRETRLVGFIPSSDSDGGGASIPFRSFHAKLSPREPQCRRERDDEAERQEDSYAPLGR